MTEVRVYWSVWSGVSVLAGIDFEREFGFSSFVKEWGHMEWCSATLVGCVCGRVGVKPWLGKECSMEEMEMFVV